MLGRAQYDTKQQSQRHFPDFDDARNIATCAPRGTFVYGQTPGTTQTDTMMGVRVSWFNHLTKTHVLCASRASARRKTTSPTSAHQKHDPRKTYFRRKRHYTKPSSYTNGHAQSQDPTQTATRSPAVIQIGANGKLYLFSGVINSAMNFNDFQCSNFMKHCHVWG